MVRASQAHTMSGVSITLGHQRHSKREFAEALLRRVNETTEGTIGSIGNYGRRAWLWVTVDGRECHFRPLHALRHRRPYAAPIAERSGSNVRLIACQRGSARGRLLTS
jgi:hypothetical protein